MSTARRLASQIQTHALQAGASTPAVRGANWRVATVATVGTDGTITTTEGIVARRVTAYRAPQAGDTVMVTVSGGGSWAALGRMAPATTAGTWQTLSLAGSWTAWGSPYYAPGCCINGDGTLSLCGRAKAPASTTGTSVVATLPSGIGARPASTVRLWTGVATGIGAALDIAADGTITITDYSGTAQWAALDVAQRIRLV